jgi:DNA-binding NarL/FixJ family response regulator
MSARDDVPDAPIRLLIADDDGLVRGGLRTLLASEPDLAVVGEAEDGFAAVRAAQELDPDVVLMDVRMPRLDGIEATRRVVAAGRARVLVVTTFEHDDYVYEALAAGASGFVLKRAQPDELAQAVRIVAAGESLVLPQLTRALIERNVRARAGADDDGAGVRAALTEREAEILRLVARGMSNADIAGELVVAVHTVKTHVARILAKLGVRDRTQAVVVAYESGFVRPGGD